MAISNWPADERPREKLLNKGPDTLSDAELLAIFIRTGRSGASAIDIARDLLDRFKSLRKLLEASCEDFCEIKGLGQTKYVHIQAAIELGRRFLQSGLETGDVFTSPQQTRDFLAMKMRAYKSEVFACLYLDNRHRLISFDEHYHGTIDGAQVHARDIVRTALKHNAAAIILTHNHPSGVAEPSQADISLTAELKKALALIDVRVLDHVVIGDTESISLAERGLI